MGHPINKRRRFNRPINFYYQAHGSKTFHVTPPLISKNATTRPTIPHQKIRGRSLCLFKHRMYCSCTICCDAREIGRYFQQSTKKQLLKTIVTGSTVVSKPVLVPEVKEDERMVAVEEDEEENEPIEDIRGMFKSFEVLQEYESSLNLRAEKDEFPAARSAQFLFLKLPAEIRNQIYSLLLPSASTIEISKLQDSRHKPNSTGLCSWRLMRLVENEDVEAQIIKYFNYEDSTKETIAIWHPQEKGSTAIGKSVFHISKQIQREALCLLLRTNVVEAEHRDLAQFLADTDLRPTIVQLKLKNCLWGLGRPRIPPTEYISALAKSVSLRDLTLQGEFTERALKSIVHQRKQPRSGQVWMEQSEMRELKDIKGLRSCTLELAEWMHSPWLPGTWEGILEEWMVGLVEMVQQDVTQPP